MEDVHEFAGDAAPFLRNNVRGLKAEHDDFVSRGAAGRLNQMRQVVASASPPGRFEILGVKDFSTDGKSYLDRADIVITCKWPSIFPEIAGAICPKIREYLLLVRIINVDRFFWTGWEREDSDFSLDSTQLWRLSGVSSIGRTQTSCVRRHGSQIAS